MIFVPNPAEDGLTHINTYSKGKTPFGQDMSNFSRIGFTHPVLGWFASLEACWYFAATGVVHEELRPMHGYECKQRGRTFPKVPMEAGFELLILQAHKARLEQNWWLAEEFWRNTLPLTHYYVHSNGHCTTPVSGVFQMAFLNDYRQGGVNSML